MKTNTENLAAVLNLMQEALKELGLTLQEEASQLNRMQINPVSLQLLTDSKSQLLATLQHYDDARRHHQQTENISAPYSSHSIFAELWQTILERVESNNQLNQRVFQLLEMHRNKTQHLNQMVKKAGADHTLYSASGKNPRDGSGRVLSSRA